MTAERTSLFEFRPCEAPAVTGGGEPPCVAPAHASQTPTWWELLRKAVANVHRHQRITPQLREDVQNVRDLADEWLSQIDERVKKHGW